MNSEENIPPHKWKYSKDLPKLSKKTKTDVQDVAEKIVSVVNTTTTDNGGYHLKNYLREMNNMQQPKHPCISCIYFKACGETTRTMPCEGRQTKSQKKRETRK